MPSMWDDESETAPVIGCGDNNGVDDSDASSLPSDRNVTVVVRVRPLQSLSDGGHNAHGGGSTSSGFVDVVGPTDLVLGGGSATGPGGAASSPSEQQHQQGGGSSLKTRRFTFDQVLREDTPQEAVFRRVGKPVVDNCLAGYNSTVLAYGQTGSGKTHTMLGELPLLPHPQRHSPMMSPSGRSLSESSLSSPSDGSCTDRSDASVFSLGSSASGESVLGSPVSLYPEQQHLELPEEAGLTPRVFSYLFDQIAARQRQQGASCGSTSSPRSENTSFAVKVSFVEIYNEVVVDLLADPNGPRAPTGLAVRQSLRSKRTFVEGARDVQVYDLSGLLELVSLGSERRRVAHTSMNAASSRSHSILTAVIESRTEEDGGVARIKRAVLNLVDLAGSERQARTGAAGARLKEASAINKSLSALGHVIRSLTSGSPHVPYRDSKLTHILQDSLGGNAKAVMIAAVSPEAASLPETASTLGFASRARRVRNAAVVNEDAIGDAAALRRENERLRGELAAFRALEASRAAAGGHAEARNEALAAEAAALRSEVAALRAAAASSAAHAASRASPPSCSGESSSSYPADSGDNVPHRSSSEHLDATLELAAGEFGSWWLQELEEALEASRGREQALAAANSSLAEQTEGILAANQELEGRIQELQGSMRSLKAHRDTMSQENSSLRVAADLVSEYNAAFRRATQEADEGRLRAETLKEELRAERRQHKAEAHEREMLLTEFSKLTKVLGEAVTARDQALADRDSAVQGKLKASLELEEAQEELREAARLKAAVQQELSDLRATTSEQKLSKEDVERLRTVTSCCLGHSPPASPTCGSSPRSASPFSAKRRQPSRFFQCRVAL